MAFGIEQLWATWALPPPFRARGDDEDANANAEESHSCSEK